MRRFDRHLQHREVEKACAAHGVAFDDRKYREEGSDFVRLHGTFAGVSAQLLYAPLNGRFYGRTGAGVEFSSNSELDGEPWFDAIIALLYDGLNTVH